MSTEVIGRPRRRSTLLRVLSWPVSLVLVVATVLAGDAILRYLPGSQEMSRPFFDNGQIGTEVDGLTFVATVTAVRGARGVAVRGGDEYTTDGLFVLVAVTVTARRESTIVRHQAVADRAGRIFDASQRFNQGLHLYVLQPDVPIQGEILFEVPRDAATGLKAQFSSELWGRQNLNQAIGQVDLGIDQATVDRWLSVTQPLNYQYPKVKA